MALGNKLPPNGQAGSSLQMQMIMDHPGRWAFHCHDREHLEGGMMTTIDYAGDADGDALASDIDMEPTAVMPVVTIPEAAAAFAPGAAGQIGVQWTPGQGFWLWAGLAELAAPATVPPYGVLVLDAAAAVFFDSTVAGATGSGSLPYAIPNVPGLVGLRICLQGLGATPLAGGLRLSTFQALTVR